MCFIGSTSNVEDVKYDRLMLILFELGSRRCTMDLLMISGLWQLALAVACRAAFLGS
jgi:hypothetical protein